MFRSAKGVVLGLLLVFSAGRAMAGEDSLLKAKAKALFLEGKREFELERYQVALHLFERAYQASSRPALLFNMATCFSRLDRPREAAAKLREYLVRVPNDFQRAGIEESIGELDRRAAEQGAAAHAEQAAPGGAAPAYDPARAALEERIRVLEERLGAEASSPRARPRRGLVIGLGVTAGVIVLAGVGLTLGLVLNRGDSYTPSSFGGGPLQSTR